MRFQTPQFVEIEDKIFGPLTLKQFIYLVGGGGLTVILYLFLPFIIFIIIATPLVALSLALAFYKVNERSFVEVLEAGFYYLLNNRLYLWKHSVDNPNKDLLSAPIKPADADPTTSLTSSKLKNISWSLEVQEKKN